MDDREQQRKIRHRLAVLRHAAEVTGNVAATCRYYGISRPTFYKWLRRYEELGEDGLRDRSSRPFHCPQQDHGRGRRQDPVQADRLRDVLDSVRGGFEETTDGFEAKSSSSTSRCSSTARRHSSFTERQRGGACQLTTDRPQRGQPLAAVDRRVTRRDAVCRRRSGHHRQA
jgi:transposase-like protein